MKNIEFVIPAVMGLLSLGVSLHFLFRVFRTVGIYVLLLDGTEEEKGLFKMFLMFCLVSSFFLYVEVSMVFPLISSLEIIGYMAIMYAILITADFFIAKHATRKLAH